MESVIPDFVVEHLTLNALIFTLNTVLFYGQQILFDKLTKINEKMHEYKDQGHC